MSDFLTNDNLNSICIFILLDCKLAFYYKYFKLTLGFNGGTTRINAGAIQ